MNTGNNQPKAPDTCDFGILGLWHGKNYGAVYTSYALYRALEAENYSVSLLDIGENAENDTSVFRQFIRQETLSTTKVDMRNTHALNEQFFGFLAGSDMLWCFNIENQFFFLDFAETDKRKVSYSTSMNSYQRKPIAYRWLISKLLKRFDAISFREAALKDYFKRQYGADGSCVIDPVFLHPTEQWRQLAEKAPRTIGQPYVAAYILDPTEEKKELLRSASEKLGLPSHTIVDAAEEKQLKARELQFENISAEVDLYSFLAHIERADFFITDSYHGFCFALIFNKPFICIKNTYRGKERFESLAEMVHVGEHLVLPECREATEALLQPCNWESLNARLHTIVANNREWLMAALSQPRRLRKNWLDIFLTKKPTILSRLFKRLFYYLMRLDYKLMRILAGE